MRALIDLLEVRNEWTAKYLSTSQALLAQIRESNDISTDDLGHYDRNRASLINIMQRTEREIEKILNSLPVPIEAMPWVQKSAIHKLHKRWKEMLEQAVKQDDEILALLSGIREQNLAQLKNLQKGRRVIANYKSEKSDGLSIDLQL